MQLGARIFVGLFVLIAGLGVGARWFFTPDAVGAEMGIALSGPVAYNQVRGDMGGAFVGVAVLCAYGLFKRQPQLLRAVAVLTGGVVLGRALGVVMNGFAPEIGVAMTVESLAVAALVYSAKTMDAAPAR
jgi:hypothetical protein